MPHSDFSSSAKRDDRNRSSAELTPSIVDESDCEGRSSSTLSWTDDADDLAAEQLRLRFEQFEAALYSEASSDLLTSSERAEKEIWSEYSPHLRVTGRKINLVQQGNLTQGGSCRSASPHTEEVILQDPDLLTDSGSRGRTSSCRSGSCRSKDIQVKEDTAVREEMSKAVAEKLLEQAWPHAKKVGLLPKVSTSCHVSPRKVSAGSQPSAKSDSSLKENSPSFRVLNSSNSRTAQPESSLKPLNCLATTHYVRAKSSHYDSNSCKFRSRNPRSAHRSRRKLEDEEPHETTSDSPSDSSPSSLRFLPPIESLSITPKLPSKRANSAMLRLAKAQHRTRPTTSRPKSLFLAPIETFSICQLNKFSITPIAETSSSVFSPMLPLSSSRKTNKIVNTPRWRY